MAKEGGGIKNITQSGSGNAVTDMTLSSDGKTITAVFGETFARQQDLGTLNNTVTQLGNKLNDFLEGSDADNIINKWKELEAFLDGLTESDNLAELLALKADKTITISAGTGLTGGGNLSANRTLSLATTGVNAGTYTKVTVDTYGRVTVGDNPTTLAGYGITDAVTLTTAQTISGRKTFSQNIVFNNNGGITYTDSNVVLRNSDGNTILASFGNGEINLRPNGHNNTEGAVWINKAGNVQAPSVSTNTITIGDAQLVYDSVNKALRVKHRTDGNTVGFYSDGWITALGVQTGSAGGGSGVIKTVYSFANLTDGTTFSDSDLDNTFNAYTIKKLYDMAGQGGLDADAMWAELKKADSSKIIDASHIPTSVLDGRWVTLSTNQTITGQKTFTQQLKSTVATGLSPLIVSSNTLVNNLNSNYLEGYNKFGFIHSNYSASTMGAAYVSGDTHIMLIAEIGIDTTYSTYVILLSNAFWGHQHYSALQLHIACTNNDNNGNKTPRCSVNVMSMVGSHARSVYYKVENNKAYIFIKVEGGNQYGRWASTILQNYNSITNNNANTTGNITLRFAFNQANSGLSDAIYVNYISSTGLANTRTLWGQPFNGTANVSGDMTGVGSITMSGDLKIGNGTSPNTIYFYGTTGDSPGGNHTFIAERIWGGTECSELVLFKGNDIGNDTDAITVSNSGPDRIRHIAAAHLFQTYTTGLSGSVESVCTSSALKNLFSIASNRVISYVQLQSTIASGVAPFIVASNTLVGNLNADMVDGLHLSDFDGRYVKKAGDTMTGDLNISGGHILYMLPTSPTSTQQIHFQGGRNDYGRIAFGGTAENAGWMEIASCDDGNEPIYVRQYTDVFITIKRTATLLDASGNTSFPGSVTSVRHISTVGTGTQPYQCNSTTLNTNLNADLLDNWHLNFLPRNYINARTYSVQFALGGTDNNWRKIFACSESGAGPYRSVTVWGQIWYAYGNHAQEEVRYYHFCAIFYMRSGPSSSDSSVGNVENSARLYLPTFAKGMDNIRLVRVGTNNFELQVRQIGSWHNGHIQYQYWANGANVSAWENLQSTSNTSVAVSAGGASTLADSRASSADVLTTSRTLWGRPFNGSSNIDGNIDNAAVITSKGGIWLDLKGSSGVAFYVGGSLCAVMNTTGVGIGTSSPSQKLHVAGNIIATGAITAKASSSDIRLKTDIQGYDAMGIIRKFRSVKYHWNAIAKENSEVFNHDNWNYGLIAQDLLSGGYSQWVKDAFNDYYTIDYERLIPVVWKGLQEVDDEVTRLKKRVKELEKRLGINN